MPANALTTLLLSARLFGVPSPQLSPVSVVRPAALAAPREIGREPLAAIVRAQADSWLSGLVGTANVQFALAFDAQGYPWIKIREGKSSAALSLAEIEKGATINLPDGAILLSSDGSSLRAAPKNSSQGAGAELAVNSLADALYHSALHVRFGPSNYPADYALAYEDGYLAPASVSLLRRDEYGVYWVNYNSVADLAKIQWVVAVNSIIYGLKLDGTTLVFYAEPAPRASARNARQRLL